IEPTAVGADNRIGAASTRFDSIFAHPLIANAGAALAKNATLRIVGHHGRKISFGLIVLLFDEALFETTPVKRHLLQFTLAAAIADGTIERMIGEQKFEH